MKITKVALLIPLWNEEQILPELVKRLEKLTNRIEVKILFVDDGSIDNTLNILKDINNNFLVLKLATNGGYGRAIKAGLQYLKENKFDWAIIVDSDMSSDETQIEKVFNVINNPESNMNYGYIKPSRFIEANKKFKKSKKFWNLTSGKKSELKKESGMQGVRLKRRIFTNISNKISRILINGIITDPTNGFRAIKLQELKTFNMKSDKFEQIIEELKYIIVNNIRIKEVPTLLNHADSLRKTTSFTYNPTSILGYLKHLVSIFFHLNKKKLIILSKILLLIFSTIWSLSTIQNFYLRASRISSDDGIIAHVLAWADPQNFNGDPGAANMSSRIWTTSMNWVPALFYKLFGLDPYVFFVSFTFLQNFLLPLSIFYIVKSLSNKIILSIFIMLAIINFRPFLLNLAWYGDLEWMAYSNWFFLPFSFFAFGNLIKNRKYLFLLFYYAALSINPSFGLGFFSIFTLYLYFEKNLSDRLLKFKYLSIVTLFHVLFISLMTPEKNTIINSGTFDSIFKNTHATRFILNFNNGIDDQANLFLVYWILTVSITLLIWEKLSIQMKAIFKSVNYSTLLLLLFHAICYFFNFNQGFILILSRITIITIFFNLLIIFLFYMLELKSKNNLSSLWAITILLIPSPIIFTLANVILFFKKNNNIFKVISLLLILSSCYLIIYLDNNYIKIGRGIINSLTSSDFTELANFMFSFINNNLVFSHYRLNLFLYLILMIFTLYSFIYIQSVRKYHHFILIIIAVFFSSQILVQRKNMYEIKNLSEIKDLSAVQTWVQENTPLKTCFIVQNIDIYGSWRNLARRPVKNFTTQIGFYNTTDLAYEYTNSIEKFINKNASYYLGIPGSDERLFQNFNKEFNCKYLVWRSDWTSLSFSTIYLNDNFLIYEIKY